MAYKFPTIRAKALFGCIASLDTGAAVKDQFGSKDGTLVNDATRTTDGGRLVYALDGSDRIEFPDLHNLIQADNTFSYSIWFKCTNFSNFPMVLAFLRNSPSTNDLGGLELGSGGTQIYWFVRDLAGGQSNAFTYNVSALGSTWHNIVCVKTASTVGTLYLDGVALTPAGGGALYTTPNVAGRAWLGNYPTGSLGFAGCLNDFLICGSELTTTEIGYLASQQGAAYATVGGGRLLGGTGLFNGGLIRPAGALIG